MSNAAIVEALQVLQLTMTQAGHRVTHAFIIVDGLKYADKIRLGETDFVIYPTVTLEAKSG